MATTDIRYESAEELLDFFIKDSWFRTTDKFSATATGRATMLFRGQSDATWELKPSVFRDGNPLENFTPQPPYFGFEEIR
ncbi:MAG: hypothetical protein AB8C02_02845, partial [Halioglobus sp.]